MCTVGNHIEKYVISLQTNRCPSARETLFDSEGKDPEAGEGDSQLPR